MAAPPSRFFNAGMKIFYIHTKLNKILAILNISELIRYEYYIQADKHSIP